MPAFLPILSMAGLPVIGLGVLLHIVGLATPHWSYDKLNDDFTLGLWQICSPDCEDIPSIIKDSKLEAAQAFSILGMLGGVAAAVLALVTVVRGLSGHPPIMVFPIASVAFSIASFIAIVICAIIWGADLNDGDTMNISYSLPLSIVGGFLTFVGGVLGFLGSRLLRG